MIVEQAPKVSRRKAMKNYKGLRRPTRKVLLKHYDSKTTEALMEQTLNEFEGLIDSIPYVGGKKNQFSDLLIRAAVILALYRTLREKGVSIEQFGLMLEDITIVYMKKIPKWIRKIIGKLWMSRFFRRMMIKQSNQSLMRNYDDDFVFKVIQGNDNYTWGIDYLECGITKYLHKHGEQELAKYACILDYHMFPSIGVKLDRFGTIAEGCQKCDFRFY